MNKNIQIEDMDCLERFVFEASLNKSFDFIVLKTFKGNYSKSVHEFLSLNEYVVYQTT